MSGGLKDIKNTIISNLHSIHLKSKRLDSNLISGCFVEREIDGHKGDYGRVLVIAGSKGFSGAAYLATEAAVKSGAGLVTLCTHKAVQGIMSIKLTEAMTINYEQTDKINNLVVKSNVIALGPGMGNNSLTFNILKEIVTKSECPLVIDADGLNVLQGNLELLEMKNNEIVLTPHLGEMSRLTGLTIDEIKEDKVKTCKEFAKIHNIILLLKGYETIITNGDEVYINSTGNSAMASGGMGDTLTGIIASFIAQGYEPFKATYMSAYIHGFCGDVLSKDMFCVNATHIIEFLPYGIKMLLESKDDFREERLSN
ncbi:NAD(P)H-hydrate dehydratase [Clostridium sp. ATCC 25772]|uniref:NAD(P)H-hydrate dehydratase n=1 Tax=Clostridium sp. ATCC 25772 TaxID=1676991 RepID=UPI0007816E67|nr:NAD(P)H-hydrate dehydratase [Clostridium sp. ATCC 25772]